MKFTAMTDEQDFDGKMMPPFEVTGYLTCEDSEDFKIRQEGETCEWSIDPATLEAVKDKRHPDLNGVLPLTEEELEEFEELFGYCNIENLSIGGEAIWINCEVEIMDYKAILYLDKLFELGGK